MSAAAGRMAPRYVRLSGEAATRRYSTQLRACLSQRQCRPCLRLDRGRGRLRRPRRSGRLSRHHRRSDRHAVRCVSWTARCASARTRVAMRYLGEARCIGDAGRLRRYRRHGRAARRPLLFRRPTRGRSSMSAARKCIPRRSRRSSTSIRPCGCRASTGTSSPITGAIVVAEVVVALPCAHRATSKRSPAEVLQTCRDKLPPHKVPVTLRQVVGSTSPALARWCSFNA